MSGGVAFALLILWSVTIPLDIAFLVLMVSPMSMRVVGRISLKVRDTQALPFSILAVDGARYCYDTCCDFLYMWASLVRLRDVMCQ